MASVLMLEAAWTKQMASWTVNIDKRWQARKGLEGPFHYANGRVLYYDPKQGQYWDPQTDFYVEAEELNILNQQLLDCFRRS